MNSNESAKRPGTRLNKYLAEAGIASRRGADEMIAAGRVSVMHAPGTDGGQDQLADRSRPAEAAASAAVKAEPGTRIFPGDRVFVDGREVRGAEEKVYLILNKPKGLVCTADPAEPDNVISYVNYPTRLTYAGRLDKDSRGLLLLTNDGDLIDAMMRARNRHEKEYRVRLRDEVTESFLTKMRRGVVIRVPDADHEIHRIKTRPCDVERVGDHEISVTLTQGLNRQIRRMCFALGQQVTDLRRVRIMNLRPGDLSEGQWRLLTPAEISELKADIGDSPKCQVFEKS